jgi:hypothetical protein
MKYILLIWNSAEHLESLTPQERDSIFGDVDKIITELTETGEFVVGQALGHPSSTRTVRVTDGLPVVVDGPFAEAKEQLAGYLIVDVESERRAVDIAARWPDVRYGAMEVRAIMHETGTEM